ncbi:MAG: hypothetical protein HXK93_01540 [Candidatus Nanogingivalaceae bacterium]|nr:hypothetical protein [Candidatus Nanogingivalaceae bacterium]
MTNIINLTPHKINIVDEEGDVIKVFESAGVARAAQNDVQIGMLEGIPIIETTFGEPVDLPEYSQGTYYIVSALTAKAASLSGRNTRDLLLTGKTVRNSDGQIIGCQALAKYK